MVRPVPLCFYTRLFNLNLFYSVKPKSTWAQLKPHFETLVSSFVFPQLTFNEQRRHLWENDPVDYVRMAVGLSPFLPVDGFLKSDFVLIVFSCVALVTAPLLHEFGMRWLDPRNVQMNTKVSRLQCPQRRLSCSRWRVTGPRSRSCRFLLLLTRSCVRTYPITISFILWKNVDNLFLHINRNAPAPQKFGALNMTAALGPWIMRHPEVKNNMEQFMLQFVTPELTSKEPYIRAIVRFPLSVSSLCLGMY